MEKKEIFIKAALGQESLTTSRYAEAKLVVMIKIVSAECTAALRIYCNNQVVLLFYFTLETFRNQIQLGVVKWKI